MKKTAMLPFRVVDRVKFVVERQLVKGVNFPVAGGGCFYWDHFPDRWLAGCAPRRRL